MTIEISIRELAKTIAKTIKETQGSETGSPNRPPGMGLETYLRGKLTQICRRQAKQQTEPTEQPRRLERGKGGSRGRKPIYTITISSENKQNNQENTTPTLEQILDEIQKLSEQRGRQGENLRRIGISDQICNIVIKKYTENL